jgi:hypothetical protein
VKIRRIFIAANRSLRNKSFKCHSSRAPWSLDEKIKEEKLTKEEEFFAKEK